MCPANQCRLIIFVSDFVLDFSTSIEQVLSKLQEIIQYVESRGHLITFSFLPYVPAYSKDPRVTKDSFIPQPDQTQYINAINDKIQTFALLNPIRACFNHKNVGYNSKKTAYKSTDWQNHSSTVEPHLSFQHCFQYTPQALKQR